MPPTTTTTTKDDYVTPHVSDERLRRSVMAAQVGRTSIRDVYEREARRPPSRWRRPFKPEFDEESFSSALGIIEVVVEGLCVEGAEGWMEGERERERSVGGDLGVSGVLSGAALVGEGSDRATGSLYDPLENLECMFETFLGRVEAWANKPKYFKEVTIPLIVRTIEHSKSEASTAKQLRAALRSVGPIDTAYVNSFDPFARSMEEPILELRALGEFIASIVEEGDEIATPGSQPARSTLQTSSPYLNTILNDQPVTQASTSGHGNESTASKRNEGSAASEDLLQAPPDSNNMQSLSPSYGHKSKHHSPIHLGSPSYSPRTSPSNNNTTLLKPTDLSDLSSLLLEPTPRYRPKPPTPPPANTPAWKISLSARKGHPLHTLHVTPRELSILTTCLPLVHKATRRAEECMRTIADRKRLVVEMQEQCKQWEDVCEELQDNLDVDDDDDVKGGKKGRDDDDDDDEDDASAVLYDPDRFATRDSDSDSDSDNNDSRIYGRTAIRARKGAQRYRKFEDFKADDDDEDEDETDKEDWKGGAGFGFRVRRSRKSAEEMSVSGAVQSSSSSDDNDDEDTEVVMRFEEDVGREEHDEYDDGNGGQDQDQDREMMDVGDEDEGGAMEGVEEGEIAEEEKKKGAAEGEKKGLKSGGRTIGLYGEEL